MTTATQIVKPPRRATPAAELPEPIYPAKSKLAKVLIDYTKAATDLEESRAHLARSESDVETTLNNLELTDQESADRVAVAQRSISLYRARVNSRESAQARLLPEMKLALNASHSEYANLVRVLQSKWRGILTDRLVAAGHLVGRFGAELERLLEHSQLIMDLRNLEIPGQAILYCDTAEQIVQMAGRILAGYEAVAAKAKEQI